MRVGGTGYSVAWANHEMLLAKLHFIAFKEQVQIVSDPIWQKTEHWYKII